MDEQQDCIIRLQELYNKLKKEAVPRGTLENLRRYDNQRTIIWTAIEANDILLQDHGPPEGYNDKLKEARDLNEKFWSG